ncbi:MAG: hypothetical protein WCK31_02505 [bacterium]
MNPELSKDSISPQDVIINAFDYFKATKGYEELKLTELIKISMEAGCPNPKLAKDNIANMVEKRLLSFNNKPDGVYFKLIKPKNPNLN